MRIISPFDPWKNRLCTCPKKYSLSAYTGCEHGCLYCYASSYIKNFTLPRPKKDFLKRLENDIKKIPQNSIITISNSSDPYQPLEKTLKLTQGALKILKQYPLRINIVTKSRLILRDLEILKEFKNIVISFTITTLNKSLAKRLEPNVCMPAEKLKALAKLSKHLTLACRFDPLVYPLNTGEIKNMARALKNSGIRQIITSTYKIKQDNFKRMCGEFKEYKNLWQDLYFAKGEKLGGYVCLPKDLRKKLIEEVKETACKEGLDFSSCREGFAGLNTKNCDGSSLFKDY